MQHDRVDKGLKNPELSQGIPAPLQFRYTFNSPFMTVCEAFVNKYNWEQPSRITTIEKVEQLDADRVLMVRRHDVWNAPYTTWEQIVMNRQNQSVESSIVGANPNGTPYTIEKTVFRPNMATKATESLMDTFVYDVQGAGTAKVEVFKNQVIQIRKAMKFTEWNAAEQ